MSEWLTLNELIRAEEEIDRGGPAPALPDALERNGAELLWTGFSQPANGFAARLPFELY